MSNDRDKIQSFTLPQPFPGETSEQMVKRLCSFSADAKSACGCIAHRCYRAGKQAAKDRQDLQGRPVRC